MFPSGSSDQLEIEVPRTSIGQLVERYAVLLFDAYGVLINHDGAISGAPELIEHLVTIEKPFYIVTNDASRSVTRSSRRFQKMGLSIAEEQIISSGSLMAPYFEKHGLAGSRCIVLGPQDSTQMVELAGGVVVDPNQQADVLIICDEEGFPFVKTVDEVLSLLYRSFDVGHAIHLLLPNPDLIYPKSKGRYGFTAGSIALMLEHALELRYPGCQETRFVRLGKPNVPIFEEAIKRAGTRDLVMIGDQLATDIEGANRCGIPSVLVNSGLGSFHNSTLADHPPTYFLPSLTP